MPIRIKGLANLLEILDDKTQRKVLERANEGLARATKEEAKKYPPPRSYIRTFKLRRGWDIELVTAKLSLVTNSVEYAPDVQEEGSQAEIHRNYWSTDRQIGEKMAAYTYPEIFLNVYQRVTGETLK